MKKNQKILDISVYILSFNRPNFLPEALNSILNQTTKPKEIRIFDNGSTKEVKSSIISFLKKGVFLEGSMRTKSIFWNLNRTKYRANTKYVYIMHDDDRLCNDFLEKQIEFLEQNSDIIALGCNGYLINSKGKRYGILVNSRKRKHIEFFKSIDDIILLYSSGQCIPFPSIIYQTKYWDKIKLKKQLGPATDINFLCELVELGTIAYQPKLLFEYRIHSNQGVISEDIHRKLEIYYKKICKNKPLILKDLILNLSKAKTRRSLHNWKWVFLEDKSLRSIEFLFFLMNKSWFDWIEFFIFLFTSLQQIVKLDDQKRKKIIEKLRH